MIFGGQSHSGSVSLGDVLDGGKGDDTLDGGDSITLLGVDIDDLVKDDSLF